MAINFKAADKEFEKFFTSAKTIEEYFYKKDGRYWQGLSVDASKMDYTKKATNESTGWFGKGKDCYFGTIAIDVYDSKNGVGYIVRMEINDGIKNYYRLKEVGEEDRGYDDFWHEIIPIKK
jgi:hypothetical protein